MAKGLINTSIFLGLDLSNFEKGINKATEKLKSFSASVSNLGAGLTAGLTAPLLAFGVSSLKAAGDFQAAMGKVKVLSGATAEEFKQLEDLAKKLGATTQFSASEAAAALGFLSQSGFTAKQQIASLPTVLNLAAAGSISLAESADLASNILSGYGIKAEDLGQAADVLAKTFSSSNTTLQTLGETFKEAGPVASSLGISFTEASAAIGVLGNAGIQGSKAGTTLKNALIRLADPPAEAAKAIAELGLNINATSLKNDGFAGTLKKIAEAGASTTQIFKIFGAEAGPGIAAVLQQGTGAIEKLEEKLKNAGGTAETIAKQNMQGFNGAIKSLSSAFEALQIAIANSGLLEFATALITKATSLIQYLSTLENTTLTIITVIGGLAAAIGPLLLAIGGIVSMIPILVTGFKALLLVASPLVLKVVAITAAITGLIIVGKGIYDSWGTIAAFFSQMWIKIQRSTAVAIYNMISNIEKFTSVVGIEFTGAKEGLKSFIETINKDLAGQKVVTFGDTVAEVGKQIKNTFTFAAETATSALSAIDIKASNTAISLEKTAQNISGSMSKIATVKAAGISPTTSISSFAGGVTAPAPALALEVAPLQSVSLTTSELIAKLGEMGIAATDTASIFNNAFESIAVSVGETLGSIMNGTAKISDLPKALFMILADVLTQLGKAAIQIGITVEGIKKAILTLGGAGAIAAGIALVAMGSFLKGGLKKKVPALAKGGLAFGPTMALVGDNRGAKSNPEVIAPLDKLKTMMGDNAPANIKGEFVIRGRDLVAILDKENRYQYSTL